MRVLLVSALVAGLMSAVTGVAAAAPTFTEFPVTTKDREPLGIARGPEGNVWFTESAGPGAIGRITATGTITEFTAGLTSSSQPTGITAGPDGNLWFTEAANPGRIGRINPEGAITEFSAGLTSDNQPTGITAGPDGNLWFTEAANPGRIGRITTGGTITEFTTGLSSNGQPSGITTGSDGNLWFTEAGNPGRIGRITTAGTITQFTAGLTWNSQPTGIAAGPDGNLWFTEAANPGRIGRITPAGSITEFSTGLTSNSAPTGIAAGNDGNLYFTEVNNPGRIGRITPVGAVSELATTTPNSQPEQIATGGNGNLWFSETGAHGQIGTLTVAPGVGAGGASPTERTAVLKAVVSPNSQETTYRFEYGPTPAYGNQTTSSSAGAGAAQTPVSSTVSGLEPGATYHFRVLATNASGTSYGGDQTFTTTRAPEAATEPATGVSLVAATLAANVNPNGNPTTYFFEWGTSSAYGHEAPIAGAAVGSDMSVHSLQQTLEALAPDTSYHFRVVATNCGGCAEGTTRGADQTFTTAAPPAASTESASNVSAASALLAGSVNPREAPVSYHFEWGETAAYGNQTSPVAMAADGVAHGVQQPIGGLRPATTYHFRLVASNCEGCVAGTSYGHDLTLTTAGVPTPLSLGAAAPAPALGSPVAPVGASPAPPVFGRTAVLRIIRGRILVRTPRVGTSALTGGVDVPVGSAIYAENGTVQLTTARDRAGHTQTATLWGGSFLLTQSTARGGMTTFTALSRAAGCRAPRRVGARAAAANQSGRGRRPATLWAKDSHGHFSTRGSNSVATVRGTYWGTVEGCDGTLTIVKQGTVAVTTRRGHRVVFVRAGHSYLARG